jgi:hypothetical protein
MPVAPLAVDNPINKDATIKVEKDEKSEDEDDDADDYLDRLEDDS